MSPHVIGRDPSVPRGLFGKSLLMFRMKFDPKRLELLAKGPDQILFLGDDLGGGGGGGGGCGGGAGCGWGRGDYTELPSFLQLSQAQSAVTRQSKQISNNGEEREEEGKEVEEERGGGGGG